MAIVSEHVHTKAVEMHAIKKPVETLRSVHAFIASMASVQGPENFAGPASVCRATNRVDAKEILLSDCIFTNHLP
ncbi:MAG: hypothetical protein QM744_11625 [Mesorhizobium sp.]